MNRQGGGYAPMIIALLSLLTFSEFGLAAAPSDAAVAATLKRDSIRCRSESNLDACYDAVRRNPGDVDLIVALGDALVRAKRPADAARTYRRAAVIAPNTPGLAAKIDSIGTKTLPPRTARDAKSERTVVERAPGRRFSNAAPDGQSH